MPDALQEFRVKKLKEFGCNAIRTSHNPPTPELLDACDRLGMLVMDESRLLGSDSENLRKWDDQIRRDRNHPSVAHLEHRQRGIRRAGHAAGRQRRAHNAGLRQASSTRRARSPTPRRRATCFEGINGVIEVRGWNYHVGPDMDKYHAEHPNQPNVGTEQASTVGTRGIYANDPARGYVSAYDVELRRAGRTTAESWWSYFADRPWLSRRLCLDGF